MQPTTRPPGAAIPAAIAAQPAAAASAEASASGLPSRKRKQQEAQQAPSALPQVGLAQRDAKAAPSALRRGPGRDGKPSEPDGEIPAHTPRPTDGRAARPAQLGHSSNFSRLPSDVLVNVASFDASLRGAVSTYTNLRQAQGKYAKAQPLPLDGKNFLTTRGFVAQNPKYALQVRPEYWSHLQDLIIPGIKSCGLLLQCLPIEARTPSLCEMALTNDQAALPYIPAGSWNQQICRLAVEKGVSLSHLPGKFLDREMCRAAVGRDSHELRFVPPNLIDEDIVLGAIDRHFVGVQVSPFSVLNYVQLGQQTERTRIAAVKKSPYYLQNIPENLRSPAVCEAAVRRNGNALQFVPPALRTEQLCLLAVQNDGQGDNPEAALQFVPENLRTDQMCWAAIQENGYAIRFVPDARITPQMCLAAVEKEGEALEFVPPDLTTEALCVAACKSYGWALSYVPAGMVTREMCFAAVRSQPHAVHAVPPGHFSDALGFTAIQEDYECIPSLQPYQFTPGVCAYIAAFQPSYFKSIPEALRTPSLCMLAVENDRSALAHVPISVSSTPEFKAFLATAVSVARPQIQQISDLGGIQGLAEYIFSQP